MTPAELKTIRENLGLTVKWLAENAKVSHRTATYWEAGKGKVPDDVAGLLEKISGTVQKAAGETVRQANGLCAPDGITLFRYRTDDDLHKYRDDFKGLPTTCHAASLGIALRELRRMGIKCHVAYFDVPGYLA